MLAAARGSPDALFLALPFPVLLLALRRGPGRAGRPRLARRLRARPHRHGEDELPAGGAAAARPGRRRGPRRGRRVPRFLPLFALGIAAGALLYGQRLADLPAYAAMQGEVVAGYAAAMALDGPDWDLVPFLALALALVAAAALAARRGARPTGWRPLGLALALLFLFKAGFIRHDLHSAIGLDGAGAARHGAGLGPPAPPGRARRHGGGLLRRAGLRARDDGAPERARRAAAPPWRGSTPRLVAAPARQAAAAWDALRDPAGFRARLAAAKAAAWARHRRAPAPLGARCPARWTSCPRRQTARAGGGARLPRAAELPGIFHLYGGAGAREPRLPRRAGRAALDAVRPRVAARLHGDRRPLPGAGRGAAVAGPARLYRPDHRIGALVALERRAAPAPVAARAGPRRRGAVRRRACRSAGGGPVWATVDVRPNLAGRLLSALFRPPLLTAGRALDDGAERRFRLVPALAAAGFLLSPLVDNASDYEALAAGRPAGAGRRVARFSRRGHGGRAPVLRPRHRRDAASPRRAGRGRARRRRARGPGGRSGVERREPAARPRRRGARPSATGSTQGRRRLSASRPCPPTARGARCGAPASTPGPRRARPRSTCPTVSRSSRWRRAARAAPARPIGRSTQVSDVGAGMSAEACRDDRGPAASPPSSRAQRSDPARALRMGLARWGFRRPAAPAGPGSLRCARDDGGKVTAEPEPGARRAPSARAPHVCPGLKV